MNPKVVSKTFHLATESYGGHWGPVFMNHFRKQNDVLTAGGNQSQKHHLDLGTLTIINGIVDYKTQAPSFPRFSRDNNHGQEVNDTIADYMEFSLRMKQGCLDYIDQCEEIATSLGDKQGTVLFDDQSCNTASSLCRNAVELVYVQYAPIKNPEYDIRNHSVYPQPPLALPAYLNIGEVQQALGVDTNYTNWVNPEVMAPFWFTGDFVRSYPLTDLVELLDSGTRVALIYGDADYLCNWYGGEDLSLATNFSCATGFRNAGYAPLMVNGKRYGDTREHGNFSFTRVFDAGHLVPFYQPEASLAMFNRTIRGMDIATGEQKIHHGYSTRGPAKSTYSQKNGDGDRKKTALNSAKFRS
jgi:carboxypeptidase D